MSLEFNTGLTWKVALTSNVVSKTLLFQCPPLRQPRGLLFISFHSSANRGRFSYYGRRKEKRFATSTQTLHIFYRLDSPNPLAEQKAYDAPHSCHIDPFVLNHIEQSCPRLSQWFALHTVLKTVARPSRPSYKAYTIFQKFLSSSEQQQPSRPCEGSQMR